MSERESGAGAGERMTHCARCKHTEEKYSDRSLVTSSQVLTALGNAAQTTEELDTLEVLAERAGIVWRCKCQYLNNVWQTECGACQLHRGVTEDAR